MRVIPDIVCKLVLFVNIRAYMGFIQTEKMRIHIKASWYEYIE